VGDDEDAAAGMRFGDPFQRVQDPLLMRLGRLAGEVDAVALGRRQPLPGSPVLLAQLGVEGDGEAETPTDDLGRHACPRQVARVDRVERLVRELVGELPRLQPAVVAQRPVGVALQAALRVPVGLAVPNEQERGHD
jgi:hypothetical protein